MVSYPIFNHQENSKAYELNFFQKQISNKKTPFNILHLYCHYQKGICLLLMVLLIYIVWMKYKEDINVLLMRGVGNVLLQLVPINSMKNLIFL